MPNAKIVDGSTMLLERRLGYIDFRPNQTTRFMLKCQPNFIRRLVIHLNVKLFGFDMNVGPPTVNPDGLLGIINNIQVRASNSLLLKNFSAVDINLLNGMEFGTGIYQNFLYHYNSDSISTEGQDFSCDIIIPFECHTNRLPGRTVLNTNSHNELELDITWNNSSHIAWGEPAFADCQVTASIVALERIPQSLDDQLLPRQLMIDSVYRKQFIGTGLEFDLPDDTMIKTIGILTTMCEDTGGALSEVCPRLTTERLGFFKEITVEDNNRAHFIRQYSGDELRSINKMYYGNEQTLFEKYDETLPGYPFNPLYSPGYNVIEFDQNRDFTTLYSTIGTNQPKIRLEAYESISPESKIYVVLLVRQIVTPSRRLA